MASGLLASDFRVAGPILSSSRTGSCGQPVTSARVGWELPDALEAVEAASPVDAVEAVTAKLAATLGTDRVTFLIADLAGRPLSGSGMTTGTGLLRAISVMSRSRLCP